MLQIILKVLRRLQSMNDADKRHPHHYEYHSKVQNANAIYLWKIFFANEIEIPHISTVGDMSNT